MSSRPPVTPVIMIFSLMISWSVVNAHGENRWVTSPLAATQATMPPRTIAKAESSSAAQTRPASDASRLGVLKVTSTGVEPSGEIQTEFTCDGTGASPPVSWSEGPEGTVCYALNFWHVPGPGDIKSYWVLYDIPEEVTSVPRNVSGIGKPGLNDKERGEYDPICSRGPGTKEYNITVYALSQQLPRSVGQLDRQRLLRAIANTTLAEGTITFRYTRSGISEFTAWLVGFAAILLLACLVMLGRKTIFRRKEASLG